MEQNIFDVSDDISFPWLPAYAEATETSQLSTGSSRMLETIVEETSDDDDGGRGESKLHSLEHEFPEHRQPPGWSQFDHVWSSADSDTGSVIRVDTPSDQDTLSERDFICPPKRRKQDNGIDGAEFICGGELSNGYSAGRRSRFCEPDGLEVNEYFMRRHNEPRLRFDEIGHDLFTDSDSLSYASLSRSSSLIQFESLERQLQNESAAVASAPLSGSSPSLYTTAVAAAAAAAGLEGSSITTGAGIIIGGENLRAVNVGADSLVGFYNPGGNGGGSSNNNKKGNLLTASNLIQQSKLQAGVGGAPGGVAGGGEIIGGGKQQPVVLNISDSELYSSSSVSSSSSGSGGGSSCNYASDECDLNHETTPSPSESQVAKSSSDEADGLLRSCPQRCSERRKSINQLKTKNSIESLSEDSGYCDHLHFNMNNLRVKSKSLTTFGSAENVNMFMEPVQMDYYDQRHVSFHQENRLSTVCDEDEEEEEDPGSGGGGGTEGGQPAATVHYHHQQRMEQCNSEGSLSNKYERNKPEHWFAAASAKTNIHNCTKIDLDTNKHSRAPSSAEEHQRQPPQSPYVVTTKVIQPVSPSTSSSSPSSSTDSLERHSTSAATTTTIATTTSLDRHHRAEPKPKNSHRRQQKDDVEQQQQQQQLGSSSRKRPRPQQHQYRRRTVISASSPDLFSEHLRGGAAGRIIRSRNLHKRKVTDFLEYGGINFTVSSVPECLNLCGDSRDGFPVLGGHQPHPAESFDSFDLCESGTSSGNYCSWNQYHLHHHSQQQDSVASKNFNLYDYRDEDDDDDDDDEREEEEEEALVPTIVKSVKTVTFQTIAKPRVNIRASYANLTVLDYSDEEDGKQYYLNRNTFRTSSGTKLGGVREMSASSSSSSSSPWEKKKNKTVFHEDHENGKGRGQRELEEEQEDEEQELQEEQRIFPIDSEEKNVFNSLLDEISAHFDRNLSIINDQAEAYEPIAAFLHEHRSAAAAPTASFNALVAPPPPQPPPRRTQIKTNPHHVQQQGGPTIKPAEAKKRTFDQDPTNLVTCYAASLERCTFDPSESSLNLYGSSSNAIMALGGNKASDLHINHHGASNAVAARYAPVVVVAKREFVSSTPNLNYYHGPSCCDGEGGGGSLKNVSCLEIGGARSTGILTTASSSKCGLSKGVSFCPIVSEIIWKDNSSELDPDDNASLISNQDFEIDIDDEDFDHDDYDHANLITTQTNTLINANSVETGLSELINKADSSFDNYQWNDHHHHPYQQQRVPTPAAAAAAYECDDYDDDASIGQHDRFVFGESDVRAGFSRESGNDRPRDMKKRDNDRSAASVNNNATDGSGSSKKARHMEPSQLLPPPPLASGDVSTKVITAEVGSTMASAIANGVDASRNLIAAEASVPPPESVSDAAAAGANQDGQQQQQLLPPQKFVNNNNNLIKNFKNGKAEKKGKTFLSRLSSGFRFSFRGKSKKNKEATGGPSNGKLGGSAAALKGDKQSSSAKVKESGSNEKVSTDFIYIPLKDPASQYPMQHQQQQQLENGINNSVCGGGGGSEMDPEEYYLRQMNTVGLLYEGSGQDETDRVYEMSENELTFPPDSTPSALNASTSSGGGSPQRNHVLSGKPPLPKQPPRVVGMCAKRSTPTQRGGGGYAHAYQRASSTPPRTTTTTEIDLDLESRTSNGGGFHHQYASGADTANGVVEGASSGLLSPALSAVVGGRYTSRAAAQQQQHLLGGAGDTSNYFNHIMGSEQKIGLIETNLDTHETVISGKTRSLMELGGPSHHLHHHQLQVHHGAVGGGGGMVMGGGGGGGGCPKRLGGVNGIKDRQTAAAVNEPGRPHKSMEFLLDKENQRNVLPPENELQKSHETGTNLSEHQLRVQASLQRLNIPDWYKQYSGKDAPNAAAMANSGAAAAAAAAGGILRKRNSDVGRWTGLSSKTTSLSSLGSHRSDRSPVMLSPSAHSHHGGQTGFSRWSTSHLNSNQTSPSVSTRGSFTRGGLNASVISGYSTASTTVGATAGNSVIRNSFRQPYLGWRSQEKLSQPRTPAERLASSLLSQQKAKEQQQQHQNHQKVDPVVTPEIQSSIKEVTSAIVHYVNDQTNRHSRSRSTSPSQRCWLESSFVGSRPLDSPQTPMIDNSSSTTVVLAGQQQTSSSMVAGDHYRYNAGRINGVVTPSLPTFSLPPEQQSPGSATLEDVLASLLGLPAETHRSSGMNLGFS